MIAFLGLPVWAWLALWLGAGLLHFVVAAFGQLARRRHVLTCRVYWQLRAIVHAASSFCANAWIWALWSPTVLRWAVLVDVAQEGLWLWLWLRRRVTIEAEPFPLPDPATGEEFVVQRHHVLAGTWQAAWRHRTHDDDCEHGPTRRWFGAAVRLRGWAKVSLNPAFRPS